MEQCLLQARLMPTKFWVEAIYFSNYLVNQIPTKVALDMTPVEKWSGRKSSFILINFGFISWDHILDDKRRNLNAKRHACILINHSQELTTYRLFDPIK